MEQPDKTPAAHEPAPAEGARMSRRGRIVGSVVALAIMAGLGWLAWDLTHPDAPTEAGARPGASGARAARGPGGPGGGGRGAATTVGIAVAERADIPVNLDALGTVVPRATVRVRPQVSGVLKEIRYKEGQQVKAGEVLAVIDPRPFEMALQQAVGARMRNEAQLEAARVQLERFRTLLSQDSIARQEVDTQAAQVRQLEAAIVSDKATEGTARLNLSYTRVSSPIPGRVGLRPVDIGNVIGPGDANGVALVTQLTPIDVEFAVPQDHAAWLQHNGGAFMEVKAYDRTRTELLDTGAFASVDNQIDTQTGTVRAKARFNNARMQMFPSQFVNVQLQVRTVRDAVVVPVSALRQGGTGDYVFVLQEDRTVKLRPVVKGQPLGDRVQVASGLQVGERVVTEGADRLRDGSRVVLPGDAPGQGFQGGGRRQRGQGAQAPGVAASAASAAGTARPAASATTAAPRQRAEATSPWAGASAMAGANRPELTPEQREERRKRFEAMSPEEREAARQRFRERRAAEGGGAGGGGPGGPAGPGGAARPQ
ncbi:efflux RND transporter periplasmic adaptor subunit [Ramlibacter sp.]|uniref:efflux RND transporter periplasmic adaptor subunit n=1 Tax=Ramlibacter sp. TaxID=1917967 RepID=UPI003D0FF071